MSKSFSNLLMQKEVANSNLFLFSNLIETLN